MLENMTYENDLKGRPKGYKVDMCIKIFDKLGFITREEDRQFVVSGLNFLHCAGKIKRLNFFKRIIAKIYRFLLKKVR
jgi:hypothetical protein